MEPTSSSAEPDLEPVAPLLNEALEQLPEVDRAAILLRFFESKSMEEIGRRLGTTEDAAKMRLSRAVEKLRNIFRKRGVVVPTATVLALLSAQAAAAANLLTLCPSLGASGAWWEPSGEATLLATLDYAHAIGMNRVYLAGLSNGAAGASELALKHRARLKGLVLISGVRAQQPPALPVLIVQGAADQMMPASFARAYAKRDSAVSYRELPGGHLIFLSDHQRVRSLIAQFLGELERRATALPSRR
jgi:fermentation-respiration switch protein FrsA (DUF1100 family)